MGWTTGVQFQAGAILGLFLSATASIPTLRPIQTSIQWAPGALSPYLKRPGCESPCKWLTARAKESGFLPYLTTVFQLQKLYIVEW